MLDFSAVDWAIGQRRLEVIGALAAAGPTEREAVTVAARELGIKTAYCYRLLRRYLDEPTVTRLMPRTRGRRVGTRVLDPDVNMLVEQAIDEFYMSPERPTIASLVREVARRCSLSSLRAPTYKAVLARVQSRSVRDLLMKREGIASARAKTTRIVKQFIVEEPLGLVQIDHTLADVIVVAEGSRLPIGRPWLILAIDVATRMVAGFYLSLERPAALAVAMVLNHCVLPKDKYLRARGLDLEWPICGIPDAIHLDNAKEFHSQALARGVQQYGIDIQC